ncbi:MAG: GTPase domain-containing protein [Hungatella hathewayi]|nr:GTPase domain-containing protein [Hungatella hathewayi]
MNEKQTFLCLEEQKEVQELLVCVKELIKDSDAAAEKEMVQEFLHKVSDAVTVVVAGDSGSGKTSLLHAILPADLPYAGDKTQGIKEIRHGAQDMTVMVEADYTRQFISNPELEGIAAFDMQGLDTMESAAMRERARGLVQKSDVLLVVFPVDRIRSFTVWEFLEGVDGKKMVFVMTGCDKVSPETVKEQEMKLRSYMQDEGIRAPVYCVSLTADQREQTMAPLRSYIRESILGDNPILTNQQNNIEHLSRMLSDLQQSFLLRKKQYEADAGVLARIDKSMNAFVERNERVTEELKKQLRQVISQEIDEYQSSVIKRLDPYKIKERFSGGEAAFQEYLSTTNETYKNQLNDRVSKETQRVVRSYLADLENVFEEATGFFRKRENLIGLEDRFYGSLAESKHEMIQKTETTMSTASNFYQTLSEASEELFYKVWAAREKYDRDVEIGTAVGAAAGAGVGLGIGIVGLHAASVAATTAASVAASAALTAEVAAGTAGAAAASATATATAATATTATATAVSAALWPVIGCLIGTIVIAMIARRLAKACSGKNMMQAVEDCIRDFKKEVAQIKEQMIKEVMEVIDSIFGRELELADKSFMEFRMSVNIDSKNIPVLEQKMVMVETMMDRVIQINTRQITQKEEA